MPLERTASKVRQGRGVMTNRCRALAGLSHSNRCVARRAQGHTTLASQSAPKPAALWSSTFHATAFRPPLPAGQGAKGLCSLCGRQGAAAPPGCCPVPPRLEAGGDGKYLRPPCWRSGFKDGNSLRMRSVQLLRTLPCVPCTCPKPRPRVTCHSSRRAKYLCVLEAPVLSHSSPGWRAVG